MAAALLWDADLRWPAALVPERSRVLIEGMLRAGLNSPITTSVGRLFDAVAALAGLALENQYEGHAAMKLEAAIGDADEAGSYPLPDGDWRPLVEDVVADTGSGVPASVIAARFHNALVDWTVAVAERTQSRQIVASGGVFQNEYLCERLARATHDRGWTLYTHRQVPANDGGLALGQVVLAAAMRG